MNSRWKFYLLAFAGVMLFVTSQWSRFYWQKKRELKELRAELEQLKQSNTMLAAEVERLKTDPRAIEQVARRELGLIQPGEIEYRFMAKKSSGPAKVP